ncbi:MAG: carbamoyltransferase N-terminal domain-containing protein [Vulcanimicrobiota bacterium]
MNVLGISAFYHDSAAALLMDGEVVAAAQEERFSRIKFDAGFPHKTIEYCLQEGGISKEDLDYVVFYEKPLPKFQRILQSSLSTFPKSWKVFREAMMTWFSEKLWVKGKIMEWLDVPAEKLLFVDHHMSHAASAVFCAPFEEAAVLTIDGVGEWTTTARGRSTTSFEDGNINKIVLDEELRFPHSLGLLYSAFTAWEGFMVNSGEYKLMGMAPYGDPKYLDKIERVIKIHDDGSFHLNLDYFSFHHSATHTFSQKFVDLFGAPRPVEGDFFTERTGGVEGRVKEAEKNQYYADIAASIQRTTEEVVLKMANSLHHSTGCKNLVMAGGVALNSVANGRLMRETPFEQVFIQPNAGDAGGALGAALYAWHVLLKKPRKHIMEHAYYGQGYTPDEIQTTLDSLGLKYSRFDETQDLAGRVVEAILDQQVIALHQGRFEWGPRALGNRSIMADSRNPEMKDIINTKIKFREPFRPFAPVVPEDDAPKYFDLGPAEGQYPQRFMLMVSPVLEDKQEEIPTVSHMGTGRLQTVREEWNPLYHGIVSQFGQATGIPVLVNTSYNLRGEPLVSSPQDAFNTFEASDIDMMVVAPFVVEKSTMRG